MKETMKNNNQNGEVSSFRSLLDMIHFIESVATQLYSCKSEDDILSTIHFTAKQSKLYTTMVYKLDDTRTALKMIDSSMPKSMARIVEKIARIEMDRMTIPLRKSAILSRVVNDGETVHFEIKDLVGEILPRRVVSLIWKTAGFSKRRCIVTPIRKYNTIIGVFSISSPEMVEEFIPSVKSFARHISTSFELLGDHAEYDQVARALQMSDKRYKRLFEQSNDAIIVHDLQGKIIDINQRGMELLGYSVDALMNMSVAMFHPKSELPAAMKGFEEIRQQGFTRFESQFQKADGSIIDVEISSRIVDTDAGVVQGIVRDITRRKKMEYEKNRALDEALESEKRFRLLFENAMSGIAIHEIVLDDAGIPVDYRFVAASPSFEKHTGLCVSDILGKRVTEVIPGIEKTDLIQKCGVVALTGNPESFEIYFAPAKKYYCINAYQTCPNHFATVFADITERKQTEEIVRKSEEKYRFLFEKSRDAIMTIEPPSWRFTKGNQATVAMFRAKDEQEFIEYSPVRASPEFQPDGRKSDEKAKEMIETAMREGSHFFEWTHKRINGEEFPATVLLSRFDQGGKTFVQATVRDITVQKMVMQEKTILEEQLRQGEKLRAIGELAGGVAHDFNNMLGAIAGYAELIDENNRDANGESIDTVLEKRAGVIMRAAKRASDLIAKLLAFSRRGKFRNESVDVHEIINDVLALLNVGAGKKVVFETAYNAHKQNAEGDASQLQNVFLNLALNACDAVKSTGGTVQITTDNVNLAEGQFEHGIKAGTYLAVNVRDNGVGMDEKVKSRIFEPFFTTKRNGEGAGLGLASVYGTVMSHDGCIVVDSEPNRGSVFTVYLPVSEDSGKREMKDVHTIRKNGRGTILIIDDEEMVGELIGDMLQGSGYSVHSCVGGTDGVMWYKTHTGNIDLVILDVVMPIMDGLACFKKLKKLDPEVKVVLTSGYSKNEKVQMLLDQGALEFIEKPFSKEVLSFAVARAMRVR